MVQLLNVIDWLLFFGCWILAEVYLLILMRVPKRNAQGEEIRFITTPLDILSCLGTFLGVSALYIGTPGTFPVYIMAAVTSHHGNVGLCIIGFLLVLVSCRTTWIYLRRFRIANSSRYS